MTKAESDDDDEEDEEGMSDEDFSDKDEQSPVKEKAAKSKPTVLCNMILLAIPTSNLIHFHPCSQRLTKNPQRRRPKLNLTTMMKMMTTMRRRRACRMKI